MKELWLVEALEEYNRAMLMDLELENTLHHTLSKNFERKMDYLILKTDHPIRCKVVRMLVCVTILLLTCCAVVCVYSCF